MARLQIVLFCYPNRALPALFDAWSEGDERIRCAIPEGVATGALDQWLHGDVPHAGQSAVRGRLTLDLIPFSTQDAFDRRLWSADLNFVRGEDSFVRAQWAARAFVWQPYPQAEDAHRLKLDAFLARYTAELPSRASIAHDGVLEGFQRRGRTGRGRGMAGVPRRVRHARRPRSRWARDAGRAARTDRGAGDVRRGVSYNLGLTHIARGGAHSAQPPS